LCIVIIVTRLGAYYYADRDDGHRHSFGRKLSGGNIIVRRILRSGRCKYTRRVHCRLPISPAPDSSSCAGGLQHRNFAGVWLTRIRWVVTMTQSVSDGVRIKHPYTSNRRFGCHFRNNIILLCNLTYYYTFTISHTYNIL